MRLVGVPFRRASLAIELHSDVKSELPDARNMVVFRQFNVVAPTKYLKLFRPKAERKRDGKLVRTPRNVALPIFRVPLDAKGEYEEKVIAEVTEKEQTVQIGELSMKKPNDGSQLNLDLSNAPKPSVQASEAVVLPFIDAATLDARQRAIRRVARSGIFALPPNLKIGDPRHDLATPPHPARQGRAWIGCRTARPTGLAE